MVAGACVDAVPPADPRARITLPSAAAFPNAAPSRRCIFLQPVMASTISTSKSAGNAFAAIR